MNKITLPFKIDNSYININKLWLLAEKNVDIEFDFLFVKEVGSNFFIILNKIEKGLNINNHKLILSNISEHYLNEYKKHSYSTKSFPKKNNKKNNILNFFYTIGEYVETISKTSYNSLFLSSYILYLSFKSLFKKSDAPKNAYISELIKLGVNAIGVVILINVLIAFVVSIQSAFQLSDFGAGIYIADMIGVSMFRELGPVITAIIIIGRSGSAVTAEIATMNVNEELDGLQAIGIDPIEFVVVPKMWAFTLLGPILTILGTFFGIITGLLVALFYLQISPHVFLNEMLESLTLFDLFFNLIKGILFAWVIVIIASVEGIRVRGGAQEVGNATTKSVVKSIIGITLFNSLLSIVYIL